MIWLDLLIRPSGMNYGKPDSWSREATLIKPPEPAGRLAAVHSRPVTVIATQSDSAQFNRERFPGRGTALPGPESGKAEPRRRTWTLRQACQVLGSGQLPDAEALSGLVRSLPSAGHDQIGPFAQNLCCYQPPRDRPYRWVGFEPARSEKHPQSKGLCCSTQPTQSSGRVQCRPQDPRSALSDGHSPATSRSPELERPERSQVRG